MPRLHLSCRRHHSPGLDGRPVGLSVAHVMAQRTTEPDAGALDRMGDRNWVAGLVCQPLAGRADASEAGYNQADDIRIAASLDERRQNSLLRSASGDGTAKDRGYSGARVVPQRLPP